MAFLDTAKYSSVILLAITACSSIWSGLVAKQVSAPYLDEVFHVRQAQVYCSGDFQTWDPKITTPPGLYLISYVVFQIFGKCDISTLRAVNLVCLALVGLEIFHVLQILWRLYHERWSIKRSAENKKENDECDQRLSWYLVHTAINIALFPPLFFFSGLYYTDVASVLFVVFSLHLSLLQLEKQHFDLVLASSQTLLGGASLLFRQTNIFWVAVFPLGLIVVETALPTVKNWKPLKSAADSIEDYIYLIISLIPAIFAQLLPIITACLQYAVLLGGFILFVLWNGGVVLGDKSNHVATLHLTQMLYIWTYTLFFSWPLILGAISPRLAQLSQSSGKSFADLPRIWILLLFTLVAMAIVHYNTIVHPFTLADNRHYVFYVFRLLRRHWLVKYLAVPVYVVAGWLVIFTSKETWTLTTATAQTRGHRNGFFLVWFASSALSLITAPLVEPRYFILPWIFWRLQVAMPSGSLTSKETSKSSAKPTRVPAPNHTWLALETAWYLAINLATGYIFLNWTFEWPQERGMKQRFMW